MRSIRGQHTFFSQSFPTKRGKSAQFILQPCKLFKSTERERREREREKERERERERKERERERKKESVQE